MGRSVIRSCVKLSYDHAQSMIDSPHKEFGADELPPVAPEHSVQSILQAVLHLHTIATHLRAQRFRGGALRLDQVNNQCCRVNVGKKVSYLGIRRLSRLGGYGI